MTPIDPTELSAYLDGELDSTRARQVEAALASSPALREEFNTLVRADNAWRTAALTASFRPTMRLQPGNIPLRSALRAAGGLVLLLLVRFVPKLVGTLGVELLLNGVALAVALIWIIHITRADNRRNV